MTKGTVGLVRSRSRKGSSSIPNTPTSPLSGLSQPSWGRTSNLTTPVSPISGLTQPSWGRSSNLTTPVSPLSGLTQPRQSPLSHTANWTQEHFSGRRSYTSVVTADIRGTSKRISYVEWLNSLASDLDLVLNDLCRGSFPYSGSAAGGHRMRIAAPQPGKKTYRQLGEDPVLEQYMTGAAALVDDDEGSSEDAFADRSESDDSSDGEFFSLDEQEQNSDAAVAGSEVDTPTPQFPTPSTNTTNTTPTDHPPGSSPGPPSTAPGSRGTPSPAPGAASNSRLPTLEERLSRTHPVWYLASLQRRQASQLLFDREEGIFLVRQASEANKMVLSVRTGAKPNIEHFLIENDAKRLKLKGCYRKFDDITRLVAHYCKQQDGLPVLLALPPVIMQAKTQQELASLAILGQDFWMSSISRTPTLMRSVYHTTVPSYQNRKTTNSSQPTTQNNAAHTYVNNSQQANTNALNSHQGANRNSQSQVTTVSAHNSHHVATVSSQNTHQATAISTQNTHQVSAVSSHNAGHVEPIHRQVRRAPSLETFMNKKTVVLPCQTSTSQISNRHPNFNSSNGAIATTTKDYSPYTGSEQNGGRLAKYHSSSLTNHSRERSAFQTPPVTVANSVTQNNGTHNADTEDKLSDYEDAQGPCFFRPIIQSETESLAGENNPLLNNSHHSNHINPGYDTDCLSEKSDYIDSNFFVNLDKQREQRQRLLSTDHVEETQTVQVRQFVPSQLQTKNSKPVIFTFNVEPSTPMETPVSPPTTAKSSAYLPVSPPHHSKVGMCQSATSSQYSSPAYIEPYDSLVGRVEGASHTKPVVKVNNLLKQSTQATRINGTMPHNNTVPVHSGAAMKPPMSPPHLHKSSTLPTFRTKVQDKPAAKMEVTTKPVNNSSLWQRRKISAPTLEVNRTTTNQQSASTNQQSISVSTNHQAAVLTHHQSAASTNFQSAANTGSGSFFGRSQSMKLLACEEEARDPRAQTLPQDVQELLAKHQRKSSHNHRLLKRNTTPQLSDSPSTTEDAKLSAVNDILGDLEQLNILIDKQTPPPTVTLRRFPRAHSQTSLNSTQTSFSDTPTVDDVLYNVSPELTLRPIKPLTVKNLQRMSDYDNLSHHGGGRGANSRRTVVSSVGTQYCQPWDSDFLQDLVTLGAVAQQGKFSAENLTPRHSLNVSRPHSVAYSAALSESGRAPSSENSFDLTPTPGHHTPPHMGPPDVTGHRISLDDPIMTSGGVISDEDEGMEDDLNLGQVRTAQHGMEPDIVPTMRTGVGAPPGGTKNRLSLPGLRVREYVSNLSEDKMTHFGKVINNFISCTKEGHENNPHIVIRNVRQFMNGIKNYLVQNGEASLNQVIEDERKHLGDKEFLNIDALLEGALHKCVIKPLERHILGLFIEDYRRNASLQQLKDNIEYARTKSSYELGIKRELLPSETRSLEKAKNSLHRMQKAYSPIKKLQHLLTATQDIYTLIQEMEDSETASSTNSTVSLGADDFLPMFIYVLVQCGMVSAEIEADYMWGLLHPCILAGEGGYHLTILSSAVHVLKHLRQTMEATSNSPRLPSLGDLQGFMKIIIPDEKNHSIITKILPVRPNMTTKDVCNMIAHRFRVTNPQDHSLYLLISGMGGSEDRLQDHDCPQQMKENILRDGRECVFAYKRINAKFVWPIIFKD